MRVRSEAAQQRERERKRRYEQQRVRPARTCPGCGEQYHPTGGKQKHCTKACGHAARYGWPSSPVRFAACQRCGQAFRVRRAGQRNCGACPPLGAVITLQCGDCGQGIAWTVAFAGRPRYCEACRVQRERTAKRQWHRRTRSRRKHRQRARYYGVPYEPVDRQYVFERDRWCCQLCGKPVARTKQAPHPKAPTIDCIIPLSVPGSPGYVLSNVQLAHFLCNSEKYNRIYQQQLRLIG